MASNAAAAAVSADWMRFHALTCTVRANHAAAIDDEATAFVVTEFADEDRGPDARVYVKNNCTATNDSASSTLAAAKITATATNAAYIARHDFWRYRASTKFNTDKARYLCMTVNEYDVFDHFRPCR